MSSSLHFARPALGFCSPFPPGNHGWPPLRCQLASSASEPRTRLRKHRKVRRLAAPQGMQTDDLLDTPEVFLVTDEHADSGDAYDLGGSYDSGESYGSGGSYNSGESRDELASTVYVQLEDTVGSSGSVLDGVPTPVTHELHDMSGYEPLLPSGEASADAQWAVEVADEATSSSSTQPSAALTSSRTPGDYAVGPTSSEQEQQDATVLAIVGVHQDSGTVSTPVGSPDGSTEASPGAAAVNAAASSGILGMSSAGASDVSDSEAQTEYERRNQAAAETVATLAEAGAALAFLGRDIDMGVGRQASPTRKKAGERERGPLPSRPGYISSGMVEEEAAGTGSGRSSSIHFPGLQEAGLSETGPRGKGAKRSNRARRRAFVGRLNRATVLKKVLGIPEPGERISAKFKEQRDRVKHQMEMAVRSAQQSALAEVISGLFFIFFPLSIGIAAYTLVGHLINQIQPATAPAAPEPSSWFGRLTDTWQQWMMSGQAAGAAGAFAGFAGFGIAAKTAAPAAALMTSSMSEMDTLWRSFGGASLVALYWKTFVFGKTFRAVEWDLDSQEVPEGPMHSLTIRVPSLWAVKSKIAAENRLEDPSVIEQLALWVPGSGDFVEPLLQAKDLTLVPELGYIVWSTVPASRTPFPHRAFQRLSRKKEQEGDPAVIQSVQIIEAIASAWISGSLGPTLGFPAEECFLDSPAFRERVNGSLNSIYAQASPKMKSPMTEEERDALIHLAASEDRGLLILFQAFGSGSSFVYHALYYLRSLKCQV